MKKMLIIILSLVIVPFAASADGEQGRQVPGDRMAQIQKNLGLSDEQVAQIRHIRDNGGGREKILAVLSNEQRALMKKRRAERKARGRKGRHHPPPESAGNKDAQQDKHTTH